MSGFMLQAGATPMGNGAAHPIPLRHELDPRRAASRFTSGSAPVGRSCRTSDLSIPQLTLPEGADALSGSFPIFPTILCAQSPMARQDPRLVARSSSVSPAIPSRSGVEG